ncbi:unnamed protein product [Ambrosiozyma monospora]|uniref:Unnamed protein product n=1 Tax=Ambrosiozyma monospora TaxID=43982 RepID=A0ACB5TZ47_AMBMO|nr:unnamed protein product [Ambrosiozyma monospora]
MWKVSMNTVASPFFFTTNSKASTGILSQQLQSSKRFLYYYSNRFLTKSSQNFNGNHESASISSQTQFIPNYRILPSGHGQRLSSTSSSTTITSSEKSSVIEQVAKNALACHPPSKNSIEASTSHIPFNVKGKEPSNKNEFSVLQRLQKGESLTIKQIYQPYLALTKPNLTFLIMLSSICSYALAPNPLNVVTFMNLTGGILLTSGAANAINMGREPHLDSKMARTSTRPIVRGLVTPNEAYTFAAVTGSLGCAILWFGVNPIVSMLAALNIVLYSWIYTSLKRKSILTPGLVLLLVLFLL